MNLKNILKISAIIVGIGAISTPLIYQKQINKALNIATQELKQNNILIQEKQNKDTFIKLDRQYILTIKDSTNLILNLYPEIDPITLKELKSLLDDSKILVTLNLTKYPVYHKNAITLSLISLNKNITNQLQADKTGIQFLEFIKNKGLETFIDINNLEISQARLKDINLKLTDNNNFLNFIFSKAQIKFDGKDIKSHISNIKLEIKNEEYSLFDVKNINHSLNYQNDFNYKTSLKVDSFKFNEKTIYSKDRNILLNNLSINSNVSSTLNRLNLLTNFKFDNLAINEKTKYTDGSFKLNNFKFNIKLEKLDLNSFKNLSKSIQTQNYLNIDKDLQTILNRGFSVKINPLSLKNAVLKVDDTQTFNISKIGINFNTTIKPNKTNINNTNEILKYIEMDLNIITTKDNIALLEQFVPISTLYLQNIMVEKNNNIMINLSYKNNKLLSNGKQLF